MDTTAVPASSRVHILQECLFLFLISHHGNGIVIKEKRFSRSIYILINQIVQSDTESVKIQPFLLKNKNKDSFLVSVSRRLSPAFPQGSLTCYCFQKIPKELNLCCCRSNFRLTRCHGSGCHGSGCHGSRCRGTRCHSRWSRCSSSPRLPRAASGSGGRAPRPPGGPAGSRCCRCPPTPGPGLLAPGSGRAWSLSPPT